MWFQEDLVLRRAAGFIFHRRAPAIVERSCALPRIRPSNPGHHDRRATRKEPISRWHLSVSYCSRSSLHRGLDQSLLPLASSGSPRSCRVFRTGYRPQCTGLYQSFSAGGARQVQIVFTFGSYLVVGIKPVAIEQLRPRHRNCVRHF